MKAIPVLILAVGGALAQVPNPTQNPAQPASAPPGPNQPAPIFRVTVVSRTTKAINYHHRTGTTHIDFRGTELMPAARGEAAVSSQMGSTRIETALDHLTPASQFGPEYMTYVLWGITPEGRAVNLGEVVPEGSGHAKLLSTTDLQTFGLIVTAEPYFAVTQPSNVVVAENFLRKDTVGTIEQVDAKYELLQRGQYVLNRSDYKPVKVNPKGPLQLAEAQNAVEIARLAGAQEYAPDTLQKAQVDLQNAQGFLTGHKDRKESETDAREAAQMAEDARIITLRKMREEEMENQRSQAAAAARRATEEAAARARADAERDAAEKAKAEALQAQQTAELMEQQAEKEKAEADASRAAAIQQQQQLAAEAQQAKQAAQQAESEKTALRERLRSQLNSILETRETQRGLIVNINDVLFDFNKYTLKPGAREKLAKVAGILLAYPGLKVQLEGHTDNIGSDDYNQILSQQRADAVRAYLVSEGVPQDTVTAVGLGKADPVADNNSAAGRQQNRRVDMVVSGQPIGVGTEPPPAPGGQGPR